MNTYKYKTNINCGSCVKAVTPILNKLSALESWEVDTNNPDKILTASGESLDPQMVVDAVARVGFEAALLN